jgi:hypothetical protein
VLIYQPTFIPGSWTQSIAVPVAFDTNSAKVSSAIERSLAGTKKRKNKVINLSSSIFLL